MAGALVASLVPLGATLNAAAADGGNNINAATPYTLGTTVSDSITQNDNADFFRFTHTDAGKVDLTLNAGIEWVYVKWFDAAGKQLDSDNLGWNSTTKKLVHTDQKYLNAGTYYIAIQKDGSKTGTYDLKVTAIASGESFEEAQTGSDNSIDQANLISVGTTYKGQLSSVYDNVDFFRFTLTDAGKVDLTLNAGIEWVYVKWFDAAGKQLDSDNLGWNSTTKKLVHTDQKYLNAGTYYIAIQKDGNNTGTYDLKLSGVFASTPSPTVTGTAKVGKTLTASPGSWKPSGASFSYQWLRDGKAIEGATKSTYKLGSADAGKSISVKVTATKAGYSSVSKTSSAKKIALLSLSKTPTPKISGTAKVGRQLTAKPGTWSPAGVKFSYQWHRNGKAIKGATKSTYKVTKSDVGKKITVKVTGKKSGYKTVSKSSSAQKAKK